jgi:transforming growth factor-beta-induced protein
MTPPKNPRHRRRFATAAASLAVLSGSIAAAAPASAHGGGYQPATTIVSVAQGDADLSILVQAVVKAGLADTLSDPNGQFTVFAPTNKAFVALLGQLGVASLDDIPVETLRAVLLDHVVAGELDAVDVVGRLESGEGADSLGGLWLQFGAGPLTVNGAHIVATDIEGSNGTVHVIDQVLLRG